MPRGNGRGPMGKGPMTGREAGFCAGNGRVKQALKARVETLEAELDIMKKHLNGLDKSAGEAP